MISDGNRLSKLHTKINFDINLDFSKVMNLEHNQENTSK
jgi:hypothetical protein